MPRFNSRFLQSGTEAVYAFSQDWSCDNNWIVPPATVVGKVLNHMRESKAVGTLIVPMWKSSYFWPLLCNDGMHLNSFVKHWLCLPKRPDLFVAGRAKNKLFGTKAFKSPCLALRIDFLQPERLSPVGFLYLTPRPLFGLPAVVGFPGMHFSDKLGFFNLLLSLFWGGGYSSLSCSLGRIILFSVV